MAALGVPAPAADAAAMPLSEGVKNSLSPQCYRCAVMSSCCCIPVMLPCLWEQMCTCDVTVTVMMMMIMIIIFFFEDSPALLPGRLISTPAARATTTRLMQSVPNSSQQGPWPVVSKTRRGHGTQPAHKERPVAETRKCLARWRSHTRLPEHDGCATAQVVAYQQ